MIKPKLSAEQQVEHEAARRALHPTTSRQTISDSQAEPEFQENHKRLRADRLARETAELKCEKMMGKERSTDPGLSAAERKALRGHEAKEAIADHAELQQAFHGNLERLRAERLAREAAAGPMLYPAPELPDNTPIDNVRFSTRIRKAVTAAGWKTVGEIREASDAALLGLQDLGKGSVAHLRETLGLPSKDGVRPIGLKPKGK